MEAPTVSTQTSVGASEIISETSSGCGGGVGTSKTVHQRLRHVEAMENTVVSNAPNILRSQDLNSEWLIVQKKSTKRYKLIGQKGSSSITPSGKFKASDVTVPLFISNVSKEPCEQDIISYIKDKTNETVSLKLIKMKTSKKYNAYKLFVSKSRLDLFLRDDF